MKTVECKYCKKHIVACNIHRHEKSCQREKINFISLDISWKHGENYKCPYCDKLYSEKGICTHIVRMHIPNDKKWGGPKKGISTWNTGLTKETDDRVKKNVENWKLSNPNGTFFGKHHREEVKNRISEKLSINNKGGRCKWYKICNPSGIEFNVQGTWELKFSKVLSLIDPDWVKIGIGMEEHSFKWIDNEGMTHMYTPDFWSPKLQKYFEVKGYLREHDAIKMQYVIEQYSDITIEIVKKYELNQYFKLFNLIERV